MAERVHKSFRLPVDLASELDRYAAGHSTSATAVAEAALRDYLSGGTRHGTERGTERGTGSGTDGATGTDGESEAMRALTAQLAVKDGQIARLMDALAQAQETVKAAQVLDAARTAKALEGETGDPEGDGEAVHSVAQGERGILQRIRERFGWGSK